MIIAHNEAQEQHEGSHHQHVGQVLTRKMAIIETINDELKNMAEVEHSKHRSFDNFIVNMLGALAAYCFFPKKQSIACERAIDTQLALF